MARIHRTVQKDLHDPDNHDGVITHLEPDILECEVKWALGSFTMNKASRSDGIPVKLFQILRDDAVKVLHSVWQQIWKTQQCNRTAGDNEGQGSLVCCSPWGHKESDTTEQLNNKKKLLQFL